MNIGGNTPFRMRRLFVDPVECRGHRAVGIANQIRSVGGIGPPQNFRAADKQKPHFGAAISMTKSRNSWTKRMANKSIVGQRLFGSKLSQFFRHLRFALSQFLAEAMARESPEHHELYLFRPRLRPWLFRAGVFVLYSQLVSTGTTGVFRYTPNEPGIHVGVSPPIYEALLLFQPPDSIGTINFLQARGLDVEYSPIVYAVWTIFPPVIGAMPLFLASIARKNSLLTRLVLVVGCCLGMASAFLIKLYEFSSGSLGWAFSAQTMTNAPLSQPTHPIYGYFELIGGFFLPVTVYPLLAVYVVGSTCLIVGRRLFKITVR